jgi:GNAT superfamily N-acetyltransferase
MKIRLAVPEEAEECWNIRNLSIREGCKPSYCASVLEAWTPEAMPEHYRAVITENPFFVVELPDAGLVATGYLDLTEGSVEAIFTLPDYFGKGFASLIIETIKDEAVKEVETVNLDLNTKRANFLRKAWFYVYQRNDIPLKTCQNRPALHGYVHHIISLSFLVLLAG